MTANNSLWDYPVDFTSPERKKLNDAGAAYRSRGTDAEMFVRRGRQYRNAFREKINILIAMQDKDNEEWRTRHREMDEKIKILISTQIATDEQLTRTEKAIEALSASQGKTEESLKRFLDGLSKGRNGSSSK